MNYNITRSYFKKVPESIETALPAFMIIFSVLGFFFSALFLLPILAGVATITSDVKVDMLSEALFVSGITGFIPLVISILLFVGGIVIIVRRKKALKALIASIPTDEQYDAEVNKYIAGLKPVALEKLGVDEDEVNEIEPISLGGFCFSSNENSLVKEGKDGYLRTNNYKIVILFFSRDEVNCYTKEFCTTDTNCIEKTDVYFYKDVVSVSTSTEQIKGSTKIREKVILVTAGGTTLSVTVADAGMAQQSVHAMRALLKEKKRS